MVFTKEQSLKKILDKEKAKTKRHNELVKTGLAKRHKLVAYIEDCAIAKKHGLTMEELA